MGSSCCTPQINEVEPESGLEVLTKGCKSAHALRKELRDEKRINPVLQEAWTLEKQLLMMKLERKEMECSQLEEDLQRKSQEYQLTMTTMIQEMKKTTREVMEQQDQWEQQRNQMRLEMEEMAQRIEELDEQKELRLTELDEQMSVELKTEAPMERVEEVETFEELRRRLEKLTGFHGPDVQQQLQTRIERKVEEHQRKNVFGKEPVVG